MLKIDGDFNSVQIYFILNTVEVWRQIYNCEMIEMETEVPW